MDPTYDVVWPLGRISAMPVRGAPRASHPACLAFLWDSLPRGERLWATLCTELSGRFPGIRLVGPDAFGIVHGPDERAVLKELPGKLREQKVDAVIVGLGGGASGSAAVVRAALAAEQAGVPAVSVISSPYMALAGSTAAAFGVRVPIAEYPGVLDDDSDVEFERKVRELLAPRIVELLREPVVPLPRPAEPGRADIVHRGTLAEIQALFQDRLWSDGLPIIPPTIPSIEAFLAHSDRAADEVIGSLLPDNREATLWNIAANGVMAGCRPEYMPVLIAIVEAMCDPEFRIEDAGSTPGWEPLVTISGPVIRQLAFNTGIGALRTGRQANTSIGRFVRLYMRNIAGLRIPPGEGDQATLGHGLNVALAEDEDAVHSLGWQTFGADRGFAQDESAITIQSALVATGPLVTPGTDPQAHADLIAHAMGNAVQHWCWTAVAYRHSHPLLVLSPNVAAVFSRGGWNKDRIRQHIHRRATIQARLMQWDSSHPVVMEFVRSGAADRQVPMFPRPESISIVVSGDAGRNHCQCFFGNHQQGAPVSRRVASR